MRGKVSRFFLHLDVLRITPAGAGKRQHPFRLRCSDGDHPRRCGEKLTIWHCITSMQGSPPQVRGKVPVELYSSSHVRITPAGAGKSFSNCSKWIRCRDHPRRCGEKAIQLAGDYHIGGSPPQVRGKAFDDFSDLCSSGITPAGAGKSAQDMLIKFVQ